MKTIKLKFKIKNKQYKRLEELSKKSKFKSVEDYLFDRLNSGLNGDLMFEMVKTNPLGLEKL